MPWIVVVVTALIVVGLAVGAYEVNRQRKAEWHAYAKVHGCERVATKKGDINVTLQPALTRNSNVTMVPTVDVGDDVHAWRCHDGSIHLKRWR